VRIFLNSEIIILKIEFSISRFYIQKKMGAKATATMNFFA
jgi:hypothetical protein